jgi:hypothetical protein
MGLAEPAFSNREFHADGYRDRLSHPIRLVRILVTGQQ